jgi:8-oxo-dGTP diphosphatase
MEKQLFNIRVYGILINKYGKVLVTDEFRKGMKMTKFPGGGLDYGEGTIECLKRECQEELDTEIEIINHYYTTDFFQKSAFDDKQLISIYYEIAVPDLNKLIITDDKFNFQEKEGSQTFRWMTIDSDLETELTFPVDKIVAGILKRKNK